MYALIRCPNCGNIMIKDIGRKYRNKKVQCDKCKYYFRIYLKKDKRIIKISSKMSDLLLEMDYINNLPEYYIVKVKCPFCNTIQERKIRDYELNKEVRYVRCSNCKRIFTLKDNIIEIKKYELLKLR